MRELIHRLFRRLGFDLQFAANRFLDSFDDQRKLLSGKAAVIFDIGANVGLTVATYRMNFPSAVIYAFEPGDAAYHILASHFTNDSLVKPQKLALSDSEGSRTLFLYAHNVANSLLPVTQQAGNMIGIPSDVESRGTAEVQVTTVDKFCERNNITRIDAMKIDVQGAEMMVLQGAVGMLDKGAVRMIHVEVQFAEQYENQVDFLDLFAFFRKHGFELFGLYELVRGGGGYLPFANAIFLPKRTSVPSAKRSI